MASLKKRRNAYQIQYYVNGKQKRISLGAVPLQMAKEKLRQFESAQARGVENPFPTKTRLPEVLDAYVNHIRAIKTPKSAQTEVYYLREAFGAICDELQITSRNPSIKARRLASKRSQVDRRRSMPRIEATFLEDITTAQIAQFIDFKVRDQGIKPKTANHYRSILRRLFNWAVEHMGIRIPMDMNPVWSQNTADLKLLIGKGFRRP